MTVSIVVAVADRSVIGKDNSLIWHLSEDLKRFKKITENHTVIMGRTTYLSLPFRPLKNRRNIVLTRDNIEFEGAEVASSISDAINLCKGEDEIFIIGGESIYRQTLDIADKIYLTRVKKDFIGDTFFPEISNNEWKSIEKSEIYFDEKEKIEFYYETFIKNQKK